MTVSSLFQNLRFWLQNEIKSIRLNWLNPSLHFVCDSPRKPVNYPTCGRSLYNFSTKLRSPWPQNFCTIGNCTNLTYHKPIAVKYIVQRGKRSFRTMYRTICARSFRTTYCTICAWSFRTIYCSICARSFRGSRMLIEGNRNIICSNQRKKITRGYCSIVGCYYV